MLVVVAEMGFLAQPQYHNVYVLAVQEWGGIHSRLGPCEVEGGHYEVASLTVLQSQSVLPA